jgi:hypothetical protein
MSNTGNKKRRDAVFQKIYELAKWRVDIPVNFDDLERETGIEKSELSHIASYFVQKDLLKYEQGFIGIEIEPLRPGERMEVGIKREPFIHLTANGIDYYEHGFTSPASTPNVSYQNIFNRENYGPLQQGGDHNNQDNNLVVGASPQAIREEVIISGLEEADIRILKAACEEAIKKGDRKHFVYTEAIAQYPELEGMSAEELEESLQALISGCFIDPVGKKMYDIQVFEVTVPGFDDYAQAFITNHDSIKKSVISRIVNDGDTNNKDIAAALNQPLMIVNNILDLLELEGNLAQAKTLNSDAGYEIFNISPLLKRKLK